MAFLVCYKKVNIELSWSDKAIYLDQIFYELVFYKCRDPRSILNKFSRLSYGDEFEVGISQLNDLRTELVQLRDETGELSVNEFIVIVDKSLDDQCDLTISGDMYPELH